jgi:DNA mismatch repair protein MutL
LNCVREPVKGERAEFVRQFADVPAAGYTEPPPGSNPASFSPPSASQESIVSENLDLAYRVSLPFIYLGDTFIASSGKGGLMLIDHHAAHERILYERFLKGINLNSHRLLFPVQVKLSQKEYRAMIENVTALEYFGIEIDDFGHETIVVRSLPDVLMNSDVRGILADAAACIIKGILPDRSLKQALAARFACHSSVRGKEILTGDELSRLITDLDQTENPDQCPHGRPTRIFFSLDDLKKMFGRK